MSGETRHRNDKSPSGFHDRKIAIWKLLALGTCLACVLFALRSALLLLYLGVVAESIIAILVFFALLLGLFKILSTPFGGISQQQPGALAWVFACFAALVIYLSVFVIGEKTAQSTPFSERSTFAVNHHGNNLGLMSSNKSRVVDCYILEACYLALIYGLSETVSVTVKHQHFHVAWQTKTLKLSSFDKCSGVGNKYRLKRDQEKLQSHGLFFHCIETLKTENSSDLYEALPDGLFVRDGRQDPSVTRPFTFGRSGTNVLVATQVRNHKATAELRRWEKIHYPYTDRRVGTVFHLLGFVAGLYGHEVYSLNTHFELPLEKAIQKALAAVDYDHFLPMAALDYVADVQKLHIGRDSNAQSSLSRRANLQYWQLMNRSCSKLKNPDFCIARYKRTAQELGIVAKSQ